MAAVAEPISPQEYLALERPSETRNEFVNGIIRPRAISNHRHNSIMVNVGCHLHSQLRGTPYVALMCNMRTKVTETNSYFYPDIVIPCRDSLHEDEQNDTLLNPIMIVEIFSDSTESFDRGEKFRHYRRSESFTEYLLIAQDKHHIEHYVRQSDGNWLFAETMNMDESIHLPSLDCDLPLNEVYEEVEFDTDISGLNGSQHH